MSHIRSVQPCPFGHLQQDNHIRQSPTVALAARRRVLRVRGRAQSFLNQAFQGRGMWGQKMAQATATRSSIQP